MKKKISTIIVAGGMGKRIGLDMPKAFILLKGKPMFIYSLEIFDRHDSIDEIVIVVPKGYIEETFSIISEYNITTNIKVVEGGKERWNSVINGLSNIEDNKWVLIHDAARPFVNDNIINPLIDLSSEFDSVITATPEVDTIRTFDNNICKKTIDRSTLIRVGTPQLFNKDILIKGIEKISSMKIPPTDEVMLIENIGVKTAFAWGDSINFKVTTKTDMEIAEAILVNEQDMG